MKAVPAGRWTATGVVLTLLAFLLWVVSLLQLVVQNSLSAGVPRFVDSLTGPIHVGILLGLPALALIACAVGCRTDRVSRVGITTMVAAALLMVFVVVGVLTRV